MSHTLIVSGWSLDMALGAAMAACLAGPEEVEVVALSQRRLPEAFAAWAASKELAFQRIVVVGVGLWSDAELLRRSLKRLQGRRVEVLWIAIFQPDGAAALPLATSVHPDAESLAEAVRFQAAPARLTMPAQRILALARRPSQGAAPAGEDWISLLLAASSRYRRFQDEEALPGVVCLLASGRPMEPRHRAMVAEHRQFGSRELLGSSPAIQELWERTRQLGEEGKCRVLITGETGVGKETVAYLIHGHSPRASEPFVAFSCADLSPQLLESRLFGHEKGAFTGAAQAHPGLFEQAGHGTLFLDEVGELSPEVQAGLLRVLQEGRFRRLGGTREIETDVRIIAATHRNLPRMVREGTFRADLYYRLNVVPIHIPPLRERPEDIAKIANAFLIGRQAPPLSSEQLEALQGYGWPGNVRELFNLLERALALKTADYRRLLDEHRRAVDPEAAPTDDTLKGVLLRHVQAVYERCGRNKTRTCQALGVTVNTLKSYLRQAGLHD